MDAQILPGGPVLTVPEIAKFFKLKRSKSYTWVKQELPYMLVGREIRVLKVDVLTWIEKNRVSNED